MRVTNNMMADQVVFNMQRSLRRFMSMQTQMSSGRRINRPSDDPVGTIQDLSYRAELDKAAQYRRNIAAAMSWLQSYDSILDDLKVGISQAKEIAIAMANDTYDETAREGSANEVRSVLDRFLQLANYRLEGRYVFSGHRTNTEAMVSHARGVVYQGDRGFLNISIEASSRITANLIGADVFLKTLVSPGEEADLDLGVTGTTLLSELHDGRGIDQSPGTFTIEDANLGITATIDVSAAMDLDDVVAAINSGLAAAGITNLTAAIGPNHNGLVLEPTANGLISSTTSLSDLNNGSGVRLDPGKILVSDGGAIAVEVDLSNASTIGDVLTEFNGQLAGAGVANVTMQTNAAGTGLEIIDGNIPPLGLSISDPASEGNTAADLHIVGDVGASLVGGDLNPVPRFSVSETTGTTAADLGILGDFTQYFVGGDLDPRLQTTSRLADLNGGLSFDLGTIDISQGERTVSVDLSDPGLVTVQDLIDRINGSTLNVTAEINGTGRGIRIVNDDPNRSMIVTDGADGTTAKDLGLYGAGDVMGGLILLEDALLSNDAEGTRMLLSLLDDSIQHLLNNRAGVGARSIRLESTDARLVDTELTFTDLLSKVEDADLTKLVTDLSTFENNYRAALIAGSKIIQPTLLDFLG